MPPYNGKTQMITGGTGAFGEAVLKRFWNTDFGEISLLRLDAQNQDDKAARYQTVKSTNNSGYLTHH